MPTRLVSAPIHEVTGTPREGLPVMFHAPAGHDPVVAMTDAAGVFRAPLEPGVTYRVAVQNAVKVAGQLFPAGTIIRVTAPAGEGPVPLEAVTIETQDASAPALLDRAEAAEAVMADLLDRLGTAGLSIRVDDLLDRIRPLAGAGETTGDALQSLTESL